MNSFLTPLTVGALGGVLFGFTVISNDSRIWPVLGLALVLTCWVGPMFTRRDVDRNTFLAVLLSVVVMLPVSFDDHIVWIALAMTLKALSVFGMYSVMKRQVDSSRAPEIEIPPK